MALHLYLAYLAATVVIIVVPGPTVTLIIANSLSHGTRAGLLNVAGTQLGIALMIALVGVGLASLIAALGWWFEIVRLVGAAYLVYLGIRLFRATGALGEARNVPAPRVGFFLQGFLVAISNPKTLVFFGAFIPQFIDPSGDYARQVADHGRDRGRRRVDLRRALRRPRRRRRTPHLEARGEADVADQRRCFDRRRSVAGADEDAVKSTDLLPGRRWLRSSRMREFRPAMSQPPSPSATPSPQGEG